MKLPVLEPNHDLFVLEEIDENPCTTQANIAEKLNVAVGTVNSRIKRFVESGCVKIQHNEKRKLKYIITPKGYALKEELMREYINDSFELYRSIRMQMKDIVEKLEKENQAAVFIDGSGDIYDICRLSCLEKNITVLDRPDENISTLMTENLNIICVPAGN